MKNLIFIALLIFVFSCQVTQKPSNVETQEVNVIETLPEACCVYDNITEDGYIYIFCVDGKQLGIMLNQFGLFYKALPGKCNCEDGSFETPKTGDNI